MVAEVIEVLDGGQLDQLQVSEEYHRAGKLEVSNEPTNNIINIPLIFI
jgi:hypothetical protein